MNKNLLLQIQQGIGFMQDSYILFSYFLQEVISIHIFWHPQKRGYYVGRSVFSNESALSPYELICP